MDIFQESTSTTYHKVSLIQTKEKRQSKKRGVQNFKDFAAPVQLLSS